MNIVPKDGPSIVQPTGAVSETQKSARERAISMLTSESAPKSVEPSQLAEIRQNNLNETSSAETTAAIAEPEAVKSKPSEEPLSSQYAVLARKEKALRARDAELRSREAAIKAASEPKAPSTLSFDESKYISKDKLQQDLFGTLAEMGLTYDQIAAQATNAPTPEQVQLNQELKALRDELKALKGSQEETKKSFEQQQQDSYKQAVAQIRLEANTLVKNNEAFETVRETGSVDDVVDLIEKTFAQDGVLLTVEEAAQQVEDYLVEEAMKIAQIKKIRAKLMPATPSEPAVTKTTGAPEQPQLKTLTNSVATTRKLSAKERALLAFEGKLKTN